MVLYMEESSLVQGAVTMASRPRSWNEEDSNGNSAEESLSYPALQPDQIVPIYPPIYRPPYVPYVPSSSYFLFPHPYSICTTVIPQGLSMKSCYTSPQKEQLLEGNHPTHIETSSPIAEPTVMTPIPENDTISENICLEYELKFLSPRDCSISSQQFRGHPSQKLTWAFDCPTELCGRLIGKKGRNIRKLMQDTYTHIALCKDKEDETNQLLQICGAKSQLLEVIRRIEGLFAGARNENLSYSRNSRALPIVHPTGSGVVARQMELPADMEVDVIMSFIINAGHFYLIMTRVDPASIRSDFEIEINRFYESAHIPKLPLQLTLVGTYCVGHLDGKWFRMQIIGVLPRARKAEVLLLDTGKFAIIPFLSLRQMRIDFLDLPFQAIECCLANIAPRGGDYFFPLSGTNIFEELTEKKSLKAICRGIEDGISIVDLYSTNGNTRTWINQTLVDVGVAQWREMAI